MNADDPRPRSVPKRRDGAGRTRPAHDSASDRAHRAVRALFGPASDYRCNDDPSHRAAEWSYCHNDPDEHWSPEGYYSRAPEFYRPRCVACHRPFDRRMVAIRGDLAPVPLFPEPCGHVGDDVTTRCTRCRLEWIARHYPTRELTRWADDDRNE